MVFAHSLARKMLPSSTAMPQVVSNSALDGGSAVTAASDLAGSGDGGDDACTVVDAAGGVVPEVGEVEVSVSISAEVVGAVDPRVLCGAAVAGVPGHTVTRDGVEDAVGVDAPDAVAVVIVDDDVAVDLPDDAHGPAALGFPGGDAFSDRRARNRCDVTGREVSETVVQDSLRLGTAHGATPA